MRSVTSCFNSALFKKNMTRFWPLSALYCVFWLFALPGNILINGRDGYRTTWDLISEVPLEMLQLGVGVAMVIGIACAAAVFSYLINARANNFIHALPVRREGLFLTNYVSGLCLFLIPHGITLLLSMAAELTLSRQSFLVLLEWFALQSLLCLFFYSFGVFCVMFTGHPLALGLFYGILSALPDVLYVALNEIFSLFTFGYTHTDGVELVAQWLTPAVNLWENLYIFTSDTQAPQVTLSGIDTILIYAGVGLVLTVCALLLYRRRASESAGDVVTFSVVRPIFKYGVGFTAAMTVGLAIYAMLFSYSNRSAWGLLGCMLLMGMIGYFIAEMLLHKSLRVFHARAWGGCAALLAVLVAISCSMQFDLFGVESRVPAVDKVVSVYVSGLDSAPYDGGSWLHCEFTDPEEIAAVLAIHQTIVSHKEEIEDTPQQWNQDETDYDQGITYISFSVEYTMTDGSTLWRRYDSVPLVEQDLEEKDSVAHYVNVFLNRPAVVAEAYGLDDVDATALSSISLDFYGDEHRADTNREVDSISDREAVWNAVHADFAEGNLGVRYLFENEDRQQNTCWNDLSIEWRMPEVAKSTLALSLKDEAPTEYTYNSMIITMTPNAVHTIAALTAAGVLNDDYGLDTNASIAASTPTGALSDDYELVTSGTVTHED